jgi:hypothetical protein
MRCNQPATKNMQKGLRNNVQNVQRVQNDIKGDTKSQKDCSCSMACYHVKRDAIQF